jgi:predicted amidohydrolase
MGQTRFRAGVVQTLARLGDLEHNIALVESYTKEAVRQGAELVVFPECMNTGYLFDSAEHARQLAEPVDGRFVSALAALCRTHGIYLASGFTEWDPEREAIFNTGLLLDRRGQVIVHYHKQFLATHDQNWFAFGVNGCPVVETDLGRMGLLICFDGRIPEIARCLALQGAEILVDMANFFAMDQAEMWGPARAYENGVWLVAATKAGHERSIYYPGGSMIVDPRGQVRGMLPYDTHGVLVDDVDPAEARDKRWFAGEDRFADRKPQAYGILALPHDETPVAGIETIPLIPADSTSKVAACQIHAAEGTDEDAIFRQVSHAAKLGIKIIALPEYAFVRDWAPDAAAVSSAKSASALTETAAALASTYDFVIALPHVSDDGGRLAPMTRLVGKDGVIGEYRKVHLTAREREWAEPGAAFPVFETRFGRIGVMMGYDGCFPEASRALAVGAADIILWPAAMRHRREREWLMVPRAADNRCAVVVANRLDCPYPGGSVVVPPGGFPQWDVNAMAPRTMAMGAVMPAFLDLAVTRQKQMIPKVHMFRNRLTATYGPLTATADLLRAAE